ncbi:MAG TPA: hypothetical protein VGL02_04205, partial [Streptomyces sp.]
NGGKATTSSAPATTGSSSAPPATGVTAAAVSIYNSDSTEAEGQLVNNQIGDKGWFTNQYCSPTPTYNGDPKGTGLVFDLGSAKSVTSATVTIGTAGAAMEMWTADPSVTAAPAVVSGKPPAGFTHVVSTDAGTTTVTLKADSPKTTRFVLIWFTKTLPAVPNPDLTKIKCGKETGNRYGDSIMSVKFN